MKDVLTNAQLIILEVAAQKDIEDFEFQDHGGGYSEGYDAYNDCHSDYYDAE